VTNANKPSKPPPENGSKSAFFDKQEELDPTRAAAVADEMIESGRHIADDAAEIGRRGTETVNQAVQSGMKMAAQMAGRSMDPFGIMAGFTNRRSMDPFGIMAGLPIGRVDDKAQQASRSLQAIFDSGVVMADVLQKISQDWLSAAQDRLQQNLEGLEALLRCRNTQEAAAVQLDLGRRQIASFIESSQRASELVRKSTQEALQKINATPGR